MGCGAARGRRAGPVQVHCSTRSSSFSPIPEEHVAQARRIASRPGSRDSGLSVVAASRSSCSVAATAAGSSRSRAREKTKVASRHRSRCARGKTVALAFLYRLYASEA